MSYILDALKRADADRERGHVPGLHSQGENHPTTLPGAPWRRHTVGVIAVLILFAAAALTWWSLRTPGAPEAHTAAATVEPTSTNTAPAPSASLPILTPEPPVETQTPVPARPPSTPPRPQPSQATAEAAEEDVEATAGDMTDTATETEDAVNPVTTQPRPPQTTSPARPAAPRPMAAADASGRPPVKVSGSSYSQNPAHRMLIANGKVVHEGQEIEPGLKLETVGPRSAVLNHRGTLYNITY